MRYTYPLYGCWLEYKARRRDRHGIIRFIYAVGCVSCEWADTAVGMPQADKAMYLHKAWHSGRYSPPLPVGKPDRDADPAF